MKGDAVSLAADWRMNAEELPPAAAVAWTMPCTIKSTGSRRFILERQVSQEIAREGRTRTEKRCVRMLGVAVETGSLRSGACLWSHGDWTSGASTFGGVA